MKLGRRFTLGMNAGAIGLVVLLASWAYLQLPEWQVEQFGPGTPTEYKQLVNEYRKTVVQAIGGSGAFLLVLIAWRNYKLIQKGQNTDRFTRAIDQLGKTEPDGSPCVEIRLGGIYALAQLARQNSEDYTKIVLSVLAGYLVENSRRPAPLESTTEFHEVISAQQGRLSLLEISWLIEKMDVSRYEILQEHLRSVGSDFLAVAEVLADLTRASGTWGLVLADTYLRGVWINEADLSESILARANVSNANFEDVNLELADLKNTNWHGTSLRRANLRGADFRGAILIATRFDSADITGADFSGVDLSRALGLTTEQIRVAKCDATTKLPSLVHL
jgi:uncharacterized protein YjbI with pentapeptide repeats